MLVERIEEKWIAAFARVLELSAIGAGDSVAILSKTQSRHVNVHLAELAALQRPGAPRLARSRAASPAAIA